MKNRNYLVFLMAIIIATGMSCSSTSDNRQQGQGQGKAQMEGENPLDMDIDGDNLISRSEADGFILETFDEIDSNGDGFLSLPELKSYKDNNQGQPGGK